MTRAIAILTASVLIGPTLAAAQETPATPQTLADVARAEEARRKSTKKATKVYTNDNLKPDTTPSRPAPQPPAPPSTVVPEVNLPGGAVPAAVPEARDQAYWSNRIATARAAVERTKVLSAAMQSRINALTTDFVNRDDPAQRAVIQTDRQTALAELERLRLELAAQEAEIRTIEEEARRAGVPAGWLRPGA